MKSLLALILAVFMVAVLPHIYAAEEEQTSDDTQTMAAKPSSPERDCVIKYLGCKDTCDYYQDNASVTSCKSSCNHQYKCRPDGKKHALPSLYD